MNNRKSNLQVRDCMKGSGNSEVLKLYIVRLTEVWARLDDRHNASRLYTQTSLDIKQKV